MSNIDVNIGRVMLDADFNPTRQVVLNLPPEFFGALPPAETDQPQAFTRHELATIIGQQVLSAIDRWTDCKNKNKAETK